MSEAAKQGALAGIRVIDFGQYIAGPLTAMLLADQGAEVIRIEPPTGPMLDVPANAVWNRGKQSIVLNLKNDADLAIAQELVAGADVLVENFRPGVMQRLGLGADAMRKLNPHLVYCSLPAFGADDPRAAMPGWEGVVSACCALYGDQGDGAGPFGPELLGKPVTADSANGPPAYTAIPVASSNAAIYAATAIGISLFAREKDRRGERLEVSLFDSMYGVFSIFGLKIHGMGAHEFYLTPWSRPYRCSDGRWLMFDMNYDRDINRFLEGMNLQHWRERGFADRNRVQREAGLSVPLLAELEQLLATRSAAEWQDLLSGFGVCATVCNSNAEWLRNVHARDSGTVIDIDDPRYGAMLQPGKQVRMGKTPGTKPVPAMAPDAGRDKVLATRGNPSPSVADISARSGLVASLSSALQGVKVLDLCIILAGPTCGRTLAEFGADVIKIDDRDRDGRDSYQLDVNRAKRSTLLDLKTAEGLETFWALVEQADVVVEGFRKGVVDRLGIGYEEVRKRRPDIIYASINCYGETGPWAERPGYEQLAQAASGMQERYGDGIPRLQSMPINDYGTGFSAAYAIGLALYHRQKTGEGQHVYAALTRTATTMQSLYLYDYEGRQWQGVPRGITARGESARQRLYPASDRWFFLGASQSAWQALLALPEFAGLESEDDDVLQAAMEKRFAAQPVQHWLERFSSLDIGIQPLNEVEDCMNDPVAIAHGVSMTREHDLIGQVRTNGPGKRVCSVRPLRPGPPAVIQGSDTESVVSNLWD